MIETYYTTGTLGDAYVILCKLYHVAKEKKILLKHYPGDKKSQPAIEDIYSLIPNISVEFIPERNPDVNVWGTFDHKQVKKERDRYNLGKPEYYPEFELEENNYFSLPKDYITMQIKAGTHEYGSRSLPVDVIKKTLNQSKLPVVIVGERITRLPTGKFDLFDLREKTSIREVINIIKNSKHFYGLLGFLSFIAASHKVMSDLWIISDLDKSSIKIRQEAIEEWKRYLVRRP